MHREELLIIVGIVGIILLTVVTSAARREAAMVVAFAAGDVGTTSTTIEADIIMKEWQILNKLQWHRKLTKLEWTALQLISLLYRMGTRLDGKATCVRCCHPKPNPAP